MTVLRLHFGDEPPLDVPVDDVNSMVPNDNTTRGPYVQVNIQGDYSYVADRVEVTERSPDSDITLQ